MILPEAHDGHKSAISGIEITVHGIEEEHAGALY